MAPGRSPFLLLLIAVVTLGLAPTMTAAFDDTAASSVSGPMFRGNPGRTGELAGPGATGEPVLKWRFQTEAAVVVSAAIAGGVLYAGSWDHYLYALDARSGQERWRFLAGAGFYSSPAIANGIVYAVVAAGVLYA